MVALLALHAGCTPSIGDKCSVSTDCSVRNDRVCDTSQPGGYCTIPSCAGNTCPDDAVCVLFNGSYPGCAYDDRAPPRFARSFCMAACESDGDCRGGYKCADPRVTPWSALILDSNQGQRVCIASPTTAQSTATSSSTPAVCQAAGPVASEIDAAVGDWASALDARSGADAITLDAETTSDGSLEANAPEDAGLDVSLPATDAGLLGDAGVPDAMPQDASAE